MKKRSPGAWFDLLSPESLEKVHEASLTLLEEQGIYSESDLILDLCARNGARVNRENRSIHLSRDLVETALHLAPASTILFGREKEKDLFLDPNRIYFGLGGSPEPYLWDYQTRKRRTPTKDDVINTARLGQALPEIDFVGSFCCAGDKPEDVQIFHEYEAILTSTTKPFLYSAPGRFHTQKFIEMAAIASGGEEILRRRPSIGIFTETVSPMKVGKYSEGTIDAAEMGIPVIVALAPMMGATSPSTRAGTLAQSNAEALFGVYLTQIIKAGSPVLFGPGTGTFDMKIAQYTYSSPEQTVARAVVAQLGRAYGLPTYNLGGATEAKIPDAEAGSQATMGMLFNALAGINLTKVLGTMASGLYGSQEMLVICNEIARMIRCILEGVEVNEETLAVDVIQEVGFHGNYLTHPHTARVFKDEFFFPQLFVRQSIDKWEEKGQQTVLDRAYEEVQKILEDFKAPDLPQGTEEDLGRIVKEAEKHLLEKKTKKK